MGIVYGLLAILFALVIALLILVLKYRSDVGFFKDMFKINNDYVKSCDLRWDEAIKLCYKICDYNDELRNRQSQSEDDKNDR